MANDVWLSDKTVFPFKTSRLCNHPIQNVPSIITFQTSTKKKKETLKVKNDSSNANRVPTYLNLFWEMAHRDKIDTKIKKTIQMFPTYINHSHKAIYKWINQLTRIGACLLGKLKYVSTYSNKPVSVSFFLECMW